MFAPAPLVAFGTKVARKQCHDFAALQDKIVTLWARTRHPVRGKVVVDDLVLQVDGGHVLRVGHGHGEQDAHQQVDHLERQQRERVELKTQLQLIKKTLIWIF